MLEIQSSTKNETINLGKELYGEAAIYVLQGSVKIEANLYSDKQLLIAKQTELCSFEIAANSTLFIFGGMPHPEERYIDWNFVSSDKKKLETAKNNWIHQLFPKVENEFDFVPYPTKNY